MFQQKTKIFKLPEKSSTKKYLKKSYELISERSEFNIPAQLISSLPVLLEMAVTIFCLFYNDFSLIKNIPGFFQYFVAVLKLPQIPIKTGS